jgi:hypothetical protein
MSQSRSPPSTERLFTRQLNSGYANGDKKSHHRKATAGDLIMQLNDNASIAQLDAAIITPKLNQYDGMPMTKEFMDNSKFIFSPEDPNASCYKCFAPPKYQMFEWVSWANEFKQHTIWTGRVTGITWEKKHFHNDDNQERKWLYTLESFDSEGKIQDYHFLEEENVYLPVRQK